jgi:hypothetical protein
MLDESGKGLRKRWIELPGVDPRGVRAVAPFSGAVAGRAYFA